MKHFKTILQILLILSILILGLISPYFISMYLESNSIFLCVDGKVSLQGLTMLLSLVTVAIILNKLNK